MNPAVELELDVAPSGARSRETPEDDDDDAWPPEGIGNSSAWIM